jgi:type IV pilus assembly protein PilC
MTLTLSMVTFMMIVVIPRITSSFLQAGTELPYLTQVVVNISNFIINQWYVIIISILAIIISIIIFKKFYI